MSLSIEERYDEVRQLITVGKEKGYLLYDEVNELLPSEITSSEDLDDLFNAFGSAGIDNFYDYLSARVRFNHQVNLRGHYFGNAVIDYFDH